MIKTVRSAAFESVWFGRLSLVRQTTLNSAGSVYATMYYATLERQLIHTAFSSCVDPNAQIIVIYFSYNGTRDWLKIEWRDQSCMKLKVVAKSKDNKIPVCLRFMRNGTV